MLTVAEVSWMRLAGVTPALVALAGRCLRADGGLPLADDAGFLRARWDAPGGVAFALPDSRGGLLAAGAVRPTATGATFTGLVDPAARGCGIGSMLLDRGLSEAASVTQGGPFSTSVRASGGAVGAGGPAGVGERASVGDPADVAGGRPVSGDRLGGGGSIIVETESLGPEATALFVSRGLRQVFAEDVMRIDLLATAVPRPSWPAETTLADWSAATAGQFHAVYERAFRERPGFPGTPAGEWIAENEADEDFRADWSVLASVPGIGDAGFVIGAGGWIVQVGVVPFARGRGIGAALIRESLSRMLGAGASEAWLTVNVNNPGAMALYRRLGFAAAGRRARYQK